MWPPPPRGEPAARFTLPLPPSANALFTTRRGSRQRIKTDEYRAWLAEAGWRIAVRSLPPMEPLKRCLVLIEAAIDHKRDIDNLAKPTLDLLKRQHCIVDDRWVEALYIVRTDGAGMVVSLWPIPMP